MNLPQPPSKYDQGHQTNVKRTIEQEDLRNRKKGADIDLDKDRIILKAPNGSRWAITVSNTGTLSAVSVP